MVQLNLPAGQRCRGKEQIGGHRRGGGEGMN